MTTPEVPPDASDPRTWEHVPRRPDQECISAKLSDADGKVLSKGEAVLYRDERKALFFPHDLAQLNTLQSGAKILLLVDASESLGIREIGPCQGQCGGLLHWHLKLA